MAFRPPTSYPQPPANCSFSKASARVRNFRSQGSNVPSLLSTCVHFPHFPSPEDIRRLQAHFRSQFSQSAHLDSPFPHDKPYRVGRPPVSTSLDGFSRPARSLSPHSHQKVAASVPRLYTRQSTVVLPSLALWSFSGSSLIYTSSSLATQSSTLPGRPRSSLLRRLDSVGVVVRHAASTCAIDMHHTISAGLDHQRAKVPPLPKYGFDLAGGTLVTSARKVGITSRQGEGDLTIGKGSTHIKACFPKELGAICRQTGLCNTSASTFAATSATPLCTEVLQSADEQRCVDTPSLFSSGSRDSMDLPGTSVGHTHLLHCGSDSRDVDRRLHDRLGGPNTHSGSVWGLVTNRITAAHQPVGGESGDSHDSTIRLIPSNSTSLYRQPTSSARHQQDEVQVPFTDGGVVSVIGDSSKSTARNQGVQEFFSVQLKGGCAQSPAVATDRIDDPTPIVQGVVQLGGGTIK